MRNARKLQIYRINLFYFSLINDECLGFILLSRYNEKLANMMLFVS